MGACLSCFGSDAAEDGVGNRAGHSERTPLLQDPSAVLGQVQPEATLEEQLRDQALLSEIVDRTSQNLIDINSTLPKRTSTGGGNNNAVEPETREEDRRGQRRYLVERLQNSRRQDGGAAEDPARPDGVKSKKYQSRPMEPAPSPITAEERKLLSTVSKKVAEALAEARKVKPVGDVVVRLSWG